MYPFGTYVVAKPKGTLHTVNADSIGNIGPLKVLERGAKSEPTKLGLSDDQIRAGWKIMKQPKAPKAEPKPAPTALPTKALSPEDA